MKEKQDRVEGQIRALNIANLWLVGAGLIFTLLGFFWIRVQAEPLIDGSINFGGSRVMEFELRTDADG